MKPIDLQTYQSKIRDFLPARLIDVHTHIWRKAFDQGKPDAHRSGAWADRVASENTIEALLDDYKAMLPQQQATPVLFGNPSRSIDPKVNNAWVKDVVKGHGLPTLYVSTPDMLPSELETEVKAGGFRGLKPYPDFAPLKLAVDEITIFDYLPWSHLEIADANRWVIMLHIPRSRRLRDTVNLENLLKIEKAFPNLHLIVAHLGRAYCPEDLGDALDALRHTQRMLFDFSANTCPTVMQKIIQTVGASRVLFGSDMPITKMRMRRVCENGHYVNLVPAGLYGDVSNDSHMREVSLDEEATLSLFLYEEIMALRSAAEKLNLSSTDIEAIFFRNAHRLFFEKDKE